MSNGGNHLKSHGNTRRSRRVSIALTTRDAVSVGESADSSGSRPSHAYLVVVGPQLHVSVGGGGCGIWHLALAFTGMPSNASTCEQRRVEQIRLHMQAGYTGAGLLVALQLPAQAFVQLGHGGLARTVVAKSAAGSAAMEADRHKHAVDSTASGSRSGPIP